MQHWKPLPTASRQTVRGNCSARLPLPPERIDGIAQERIEKLPEVETKPFIIGEDDGDLQMGPGVHRPGMVWENGKWRPETESY
jgi:hypothetical protein